MRTSQASFSSLLILLVAPLSLPAQSAAPSDPTPADWTTHHTIRVGGETVEYDATVGSLILRNDDEKPIAEMYYTAYFRSGIPDPGRRPVLFAYNGGPGSSSFWLHMGVMGPRRVRTPGTEHAGAAPYDIVDNPASLLDKTDIVMVDPVGTGFSHPLGDTEGKTFWGLSEDGRAITQFIQRFLSRHRRWNSPKYLLGESYGTTRSAVLAPMLQRANIDLNGIVLVSAVLDFRTLIFAEGEDIAYVTNLPSYAATAWYHRALPEQPPELAPFLEEVEAFAVGDYATALLKGSTLPGPERERILDRLHAYTGLSRDYLSLADLRVTAPEFEAELMRRDGGKVVGRLDARYLGDAEDLLAQVAGRDPQSSAISGAYTAAWNTYLREELGYDGNREYVPSGNVQPWNWTRGPGPGFGFSGVPNVGPDLARALRANPELEVLLVNGLYDLATPYFAAVWTMDHLGLPPDLRANIQRVDFEAGHMMYVHEPVLPRWREALGAFIDRTSGGG
jgi:carboxypeptidase C (cathepsin A)